MKTTTRYRGLARTLFSLLAFGLLTSCQLASLFSPGDGPNQNGGGGSTTTLAEGIIGDFVAKIQATTFSRGLDSNNRLSQADLDALKQIIRKKISDAGLDSSDNLDDVLPAVMAGFTAGVKNLRQADGDTAVSAQLLAKALQASSESLGKNSGKASSNSNLPAILQKTIRRGAEELAEIAKDDPESAGAALKSAVKDVAAALKSKSGVIDEVAVLKAVVTASVQAVVQGGSGEMVQAVFAGTADSTSSESVVTEVVKTAVVQSMDGAADGAPLDSAKATEILKQAAAGLGNNVASDAVLQAAQQELKDNAVQVDDAAIAEVKTARAETDPTATLTLKIDSVAYAEGSELAYSAATRAVVFTTANVSGTTEQLVGPNGSDLTLASGSANYSLTGSGAFRFLLLVKNTAGVKSAYKSIVIRVAPLPAEVAPAAVLKVMEGEAEVTGALTWTKEGHKFAFDTTGSSTEGTKMVILSDSPNAVPTEASGVWSVVQKYGTVTYTLLVKNVGGSKVTKVAKVVQVNAEPTPVASLTIKKEGGPVSGSLPYLAEGYDLVLDLGGTTTTNTDVTLVNNRNLSLIKNADGTWTAKSVLQTTTFTLSVNNQGGLLSAKAEKTVVVAAPTSTNVSADVATGREAVKQHQWTKAKTAFAAALLKNPNDTDAKVWSAFLDLATLSVHPALVALMKDRVGVADYPATMETLLSTTWMKAAARNSHTGFLRAQSFVPDSYYYVRGNIIAGNGSTYAYNSYQNWGSSPDAYGAWIYGANDFVPDAAGTAMVRYWYQSNGDTFRADDYASSESVGRGEIFGRSYYFLDDKDLAPLPELGALEGFDRLDLEADGSATTGKAYGSSDYMRLLVANVLSHNPLGFNGFVDQVLQGPFGPSLDSILNRLSSLGDTDRTLVPVDLIEQATSPYGIDASKLPPVTIGKPELLLLTANLKVTKAFVQYLASVNFEYPIGQAMVDGFLKPNHPDANKDGQDDMTHAVLISTPGVYFSNVLRTRSVDSRAASKATFLSAMDDVSSAMAVYQILIADETGGYRTTLAPMLVALAGNKVPAVPTYDQVTEILTNFQNQIGTIRAAVANNTGLTVNSNLAAAGQLNPFEALLGTFPSDEAMVVRPGEMWANNVLDPRFWFEGNGTDGFALYLRGQNWSNGPRTEGTIFKPVPKDRNDLTAEFYGLSSTDPTGYNDRQIWMQTALKLNKAALQKFYPAANPSEGQLAVPLGPAWYVVRSVSNWKLIEVSPDVWFYSQSSDYFYALTPPVFVDEFLSWVNKK